MKRNLRILVIAIAMTLTPISANALIPTIDFPNLAEQIANNIQSLYNWAKEKALMLQNMSLESSLSALQIEAGNNQAANTIIRLNGEAVKIHNTNLIQKSMPDYNAKVDCGISYDFTQSVCQAITSTKTQSQQLAKMNQNFGQTQAQYDTYRDKVVKQTVDQIKKVGLDNVLNTGMMFGGKDGVNVNASGTSGQATNLQIQLLTGPIPTKKTSPMGGDTSLTRESKLHNYRREAFRRLAQASFEAIRQAHLKTGSSGSQMQRLWQFAMDRWGGGKQSANFLLSVANANAAKTTDKRARTNESQVIRKIAVMDAFQTYMSVQQYAQQLRMEALEAAMLSLQVDPLQ